MRGGARAHLGAVATARASPGANANVPRMTYAQGRVVFGDLLRRWFLAVKKTFRYPGVFTNPSSVPRAPGLSSPFVFPADAMSHAACVFVSVGASSLRPRLRWNRNTNRGHRVVVARSKNATSDESPSTSGVSRRVGMTSLLVSAATALGVSSEIATPPTAVAFGGEIGLSDLSYETTTCPANQVRPWLGLSQIPPPRFCRSFSTAGK